MKPDTSCLVAYLSAYIDLDDRDLQFLCDLEKDERDYAGDELVYSRGDIMNHLFVVKRGWLLGSTDFADGRRHNVQTYHPGDLIGLCDLSLLRRTTSLNTVEPAVLCPFPKSALGAIIEHAPRLCALLIALSARDQVILIDLLRATARMQARDRVLFLMLSFLHRLRVTSDQVTDTVRCPLTQTQLGDILGLTNVSVSKACTELELGGWIVRDRQYLTINRVGEACDAVEFEDRFASLDSAWFPARSVH